MMSIIGRDSLFRRSFTLIELLLVVIIIGTLIAVSMPRLQNTFKALELNNFSYDLQNFMNYLEQRAVVEGQPVLLSFDTDNARYWASVKNSNKRIASSPIPSGIKVDAKNNQIAFYPDGSSDKAEIRLVSAGDNRIVLSTNGISGNVKIRHE